MPQYTKQDTKIYPSKVSTVLRDLGAHIRAARLRRKLSEQTVAARAGINRLTLRRVEAGAPETGLGAYASVLWVLGLERDLGVLAAPDLDTLGLTLREARLGRRARSSSAEPF